jgi:prepilin-type N-terminal cleavage/methylation domain-containing protein
MEQSARGFTLIEMSIVLVVIGLIVGGVLVARDMIKSAQNRAQVTQVEQFQTATNTFQLKYSALPGDLPGSVAASLGFVPRAGGVSGRGDGDGIIEGYDYFASQTFHTFQNGETILFWEDLSQEHLIEGTFNTATDVPFGATNVSPYLPAAKIERNNYVYVWTGSPYQNQGAAVGTQGYNYFGISASPTIVESGGGGDMTSSLGLAVAEAYAIDTKVDDGLPTSGRVQARYINGWWCPNLGAPFGRAAGLRLPVVALDSCACATQS